METISRFNRVSICFPRKNRTLQYLSGEVFTVTAIFSIDAAHCILFFKAPEKFGEDKVHIGSNILSNLSRKEFLKLVKLAHNQLLKVTFCENNSETFVFLVHKLASIHTSVCSLFDRCLWGQDFFGGSCQPTAAIRNGTQPGPKPEQHSPRLSNCK